MGHAGLCPILSLCGNEMEGLILFILSHLQGHGGWGYGMPELMTTACADAFDVTRPDLYDFLTKFLTEMGSIFTDDLLFLGGDELSVDCFDNTPTIAAWMKEHGLNASSTQQYFWQEMTAKVFPKLNKTISVWRADDPNRGPYQTNVPRSTVFNVYQSLSTLWTQTIPAGTPSVVSIAGQNWYLDSECGGYNQVVITLALRRSCIFELSALHFHRMRGHASTICMARAVRGSAIQRGHPSKLLYSKVVKRPSGAKASTRTILMRLSGEERLLALKDYGLPSKVWVARHPFARGSQTYAQVCHTG